MSKENLYGINQSFKNIYGFTTVEVDGKHKTTRHENEILQLEDK